MVNRRSGQGRPLAAGTHALAQETGIKLQERGQDDGRENRQIKPEAEDCESSGGDKQRDRRENQEKHRLEVSRDGHDPLHCEDVRREASARCSAFLHGKYRIRTESLPAAVSVSGKRNFAARDKGAEIAAESGWPFAETKRPRASPPIPGFSPKAGKSPLDQDCVVADAVAIEPVSASKFPAIREMNCEFLQFRGLQAILSPK
jgi:hypothetical protein